MQEIYIKTHQIIRFHFLPKGLVSDAYQKYCSSSFTEALTLKAWSLNQKFLTVFLCRYLLLFVFYFYQFKLVTWLYLENNKTPFILLRCYLLK